MTIFGAPMAAGPRSTACPPAALFATASAASPTAMEQTKISKRVPTLTKKDVARRVSKIQNQPIYKSEPWVSAVIEAIRELMIEADPELRIELRDFGVFEVKKTKAKPKARNPKTNETVFIPSRRKTHFKPSKLMKEELQRPLADLGYSIPEGSADALLSPAELEQAVNGHTNGH